MSMEERLRAFLEENPDDPMVLLSLANVVLREGRVEEALELVERAVEIDPDYMAAYPVLGDCREQLDDLDGAREAYEKAITLGEKAGDRTIVEEMRAKIEGLEEDEF